jgi:hypothetical protein
MDGGLSECEKLRGTEKNYPYLYHRTFSEKPKELFKIVFIKLPCANANSPTSDLSYVAHIRECGKNGQIMNDDCGSELKAKSKKE